jgi:hypothetical protein
MDSMIAICGLNYDSCPILLAAPEKDIVKKTQIRNYIADKLAKIYETNPKPEIISDCDGCKIDNGTSFRLY